MRKSKSSNINTDKTFNSPACSTKTDREQASAPESMQGRLSGNQKTTQASNQGKYIEKQGKFDEKRDDKPKKKQREPWSNRRSTKRHAPCEEADAPQTQTAQAQDAHAKSLDQAPAVASPVPGCHEPPKETDREAMMRYLVKNHRPVECDVRVECSPYTWLLHRQILEQCPYFAFLCSPKDTNEIDTTDNTKDVLVLNLHDHVPEQLANVFYYMYFYTYPGADCDPSDPLVADCVLTNTAMYIAGASVGYQDMMCHAVRKIDEWSAAADSCIKTPIDGSKDSRRDKDMERLADPLWRSLCIVYEQPLNVREGLLVALRVALVRVVDAVLPYLAANTSFRTHYRQWTRPLLVDGADTDQKTLAETVLMDHALFQDLGMLRLDKPAANAEAEARNEQGKGRGRQKRQKPSIAYLFHLLNRLSNIELWSSHASTSANANTTLAATATTTTAKGGDHRGGREGRGDGGDHRDWPRRHHLDMAMREHALIVRELDDCLGCD